MKHIKVKEYFRGRVVIFSSSFSNQTRHKKHDESFLTGRFYTPPTLTQRFLVGRSRVELGLRSPAGSEARGPPTTLGEIGCV